VNRAIFLFTDREIILQQKETVLISDGSIGLEQRLQGLAHTDLNEQFTKHSSNGHRSLESNGIEENR
jgi:hypothetical protein